MNYDGATGNLLSRTRNSLSEETFDYDNLDRLVSVKVGTQETMHINYADNGNITSKTGIGQYYYSAERPHAVSSVDNTDNLISTEACTTQFNDLNKISSLQENGKVMTIDYGPDLERCYSILKQGNTILRKVTYMDDYEKVVDNGVSREFYYLDGDVIIIRQNGTFQTYQSFKDNLGSILSVVDENGNQVFSAEYDAWGKQTVSVNTIGLIRGYGGHEMLNEFNLINMNGRVYDPVLGRFLSPDKYVQEGDNSQNYNSYSYCLNNPLKYADPSGNIFVLDDLIAITAMGAMMGAMNAAMSDKPIWKGALLGGLSAAATYGIGSVFGSVGSFGHELLRAGAHGLSSGVFNALNGDNFWNGLISGAASSGIGSYAQSVNLNSGLMVASTTAMGGVVAWATGGDFLQGAMQGMNIGLFNHTAHDGNGGTRLYRDQDGELFGGEIPEVIVRPSKTPIITLIVYAASMVGKYRSAGTYTMYSYDEEVLRSPAVSGAGNIRSYTLPSGNYSVIAINNRAETKFTRKGVGWTANLSPDPFYDEYAGRNRQYIRIHPARSLGTEGCIGLTSNNPFVLRRARDLIRNTLDLKGNIPLNVIISGR
jgi:RHS repeat-associated protein